jgi:hypothetical protein
MTSTNGMISQAERGRGQRSRNTQRDAYVRYPANATLANDSHGQLRCMPEEASFVGMSETGSLPSHLV